MTVRIFIMPTITKTIRNRPMAGLARPCVNRKSAARTDPRLFEGGSVLDGRKSVKND